MNILDLREKNSTYEYSSNNLTKAVLPGGAELKYTYDSSHNVSTATSKQNVKSTFTCDKYGNNTSVKMLNANNTAGSVIEANATYTTDGNFIASLTNVDRKTILYGYNPEVGVLAWIQGLGDTENTRVQLGYDGMYRITGVSKAVTGFTGGLSRAYVEYSYEDDNLKTVSHSNTASAKTKYTFDYAAFDALSTVYVGDKQLIHYEYDNDSHSYNLLREIYPNGGFKGYSYDSHGRVLSESYDRNNSHVVTYAYDNEDNLGSVTDKRNNITQRYLYDLSGRQTEIIQSGSASRRQKFYYDEANNLSRYDENVNGKNFTSYYNYDKDNRQSEYKIGAIHRGWLYDGYGRLYGINTIYDGKYVLNTTIYHENPDSTHVSTRVNGWKNETLGGDTRHFEYGYDSAGNIALLRMGGKTTTYRYNALQQLVRENNQAAGKTWLYTYDAGGNILTKKEYAYTTGTVGTVQKTINYTYGNNQWKDLLTAYNGKTISSDAVGNMTSDGTWTYTWEHGKQLAGQSKSGTTISYAYGAGGMRLKKTVGSTTYTYAYNGSLLTNVASSAEQNVHIRYDSEGKPVHMQYNKDGDEYYYMLDAQGNVVGLVDGSGKLVVEYTYDAWGQLLSMTGSLANDLGKANPLRYRSYVYDDETGMYYLGSRYYNPTMCRFINADSVSVVHEANGKLTDKNLFAYCDNNPVMRKDGGGEFWTVLAGAVIGAITNVAATVISNAASGSETSLGQVVVAAVSGAASGALASTGATFWAKPVGQVLGSALISMGETVASSAIQGEVPELEEVLVNGMIGATCSFFSQGTFACDQPAIGKARQEVISARGTLGSAICGTAKGTNVKKAWSSYIGANISLLQKTKEHLLPTTMLYAGGLIYGTMGKQRNHVAWKQVGPMLKGQKR